MGQNKKSVFEEPTNDEILSTLYANIDAFFTTFVQDREFNDEMSSERELRFGSKGSLVACVDEDSDDLGSWRDFEADRGGGPIQLIEAQYECSNSEAWDKARAFCDGFEIEDARPRPTEEDREARKLEKIRERKRDGVAKVQKLLKRSNIRRKPFRLPARYLQQRRFFIEHWPNSVAFRFGWLKAKDPLWKNDSIVFAATNSAYETQALQFVFVRETPNGNPFSETPKTKRITKTKKTHGCLHGAAVKMHPKDPKHEELVFVDGPEDALSVYAAGWACWATLGVGNLLTQEPPPGVPIIIFADKDKEGGVDSEHIIAESVERFEKMGHSVRVVVADQDDCKDANDVLRKHGMKALRRTLEVQRNG